MNLDELRKVAENATPGPWESIGGSHILENRGASVAQVWGVNWRNNQRFIATFNPEMVLALLDRVEKAEQAIARVREQHQVDEYTAGHTIVRCVCEEMWPCSTIKALGGGE